MAAPSADGMHVHDVRTQAPVNGDPDPEADRFRAHRESPVGGFAVQEQPAEAAPEPGFLAPRRLAAAACGFGQATTGLVGETEPPLPELRPHVLRGAPQGGDLEVVDAAGAVHGDVVDHPTAHEVDEEGSQAYLEDVGAQGDPNRAPRLLGRDDPADQLLEVLAPVGVGQGVQEPGEAGERIGRRAEVAQRDEGGTGAQRVGAHRAHRREGMVFVARERHLRCSLGGQPSAVARKRETCGHSGAQRLETAS